MNTSRLYLIALLCVPLILVSCLDDKHKDGQINAEMLQEFQNYMKFKEQTANDNQQKVSNKKTQAVIDKNFSIIEKTRDELQKEFENRRDILAKRPSDLRMAFEIISKILSERKSMLQEKETAESSEKAVLAVVTAYDDIMPKIQNLVTLIRCLDMITSNTSSIIDALKQHPNTEAVNQKEAEELWNKIEPSFRYSSDSQQLSVKNLFINVTKSKFEDKQNVPSYYMFHLMSDILEKLKNSSETLNQAAFLRSFENATYSVQKFISDLDETIKSDQTAKNTVIFLDEAKKTTMSQLDFIQKRMKEWKEYLSSIETLSKRTLDIVKDCVESEKDQSIFDKVETNVPEDSQ